MLSHFYQRVQKHGESAEEYIRSLYDVADTCSFAGVKNENIRDRLVISIIDKELSENLQLTPDSTLDKAVEFTLVKLLREGNVRQSQQNRSNVKPAQEKQRKNCYRCGKPHAKDERCPARNAECHTCKMMGQLR